MIFVNIVPVNPQNHPVISKNKNKLHSIKAIPYGSGYQLNFNFDPSAQDNSYGITGNRKELQWLCDELQQWHDIPIYFWDAPSAH